MYTEHHFDTWHELEAFALGLGNGKPRPAGADFGYTSDFLFRGQGDPTWSLESTLERYAPKLTRLTDYYRAIAIAQIEIESLLPRTWPEVDSLEMRKHLSDYDAVSMFELPHYTYLVHLRHHGFPSPLLDWSRSLYVAAFFAFQQPVGERAAIFAFQEYSGVGKARFSDAPQIRTLGRNIRTHPRHFHQQAEYTSALRFHEGTWHLAKHLDVASTTRDQDNLWKLTAPSNDRSDVFRQLEAYNINAYSLFQTEEALLSTLANRLLRRQ